MRILPLILLFLMAAPNGTPQKAPPADRVWINGRIVTMDAAGATVQAVAVRAGQIVATGTDAAIRKLVASSTTVTDLAGKTMLPGFYAAHDHFPGAGSIGLYRVDLSSPPIGAMRTIDDIVAALRRKASETRPGAWIVGRGYDDTLLREKRHPDRADLDRASTDHPIWIEHVSGHLGAANSLALARTHITRDTTARNGVVWKDPKTGEPTGVFEECGGLVTSHIPAAPEALRAEAVRRADAEYLSRGVTTAVIAGMSRATFTGLERRISDNLVHLRLVAMLSVGAKTPASRAQALALAARPDRLWTGALKMFADGSIQGYTGYLTQPYYRQPEGKHDDRGYPRHSRAELAALVTEWHRAGYQIAIHANGDAAIDDVLYAFRTAQREFPRPDARHRIEHCQMARENQLDQMKELGITPSFFVGHVYYWGDRHRDIFLGPERAAHISPLASAARRGLHFTLHNDTPVTPVNPLLLVWCAVNRLTSDGKVLGPDQRIPVMEALRAVTSDAAWQNFEEKRKGSIEPGKLADFVVLGADPLEIAPARIRDVPVLETIVGGKTVYRASPAAALRGDLHSGSSRAQP